MVAQSVGFNCLFFVMVVASPAGGSCWCQLAAVKSTSTVQAAELSSPTDGEEWAFAACIHDQCRTDREHLATCLRDPGRTFMGREGLEAIRKVILSQMLIWKDIACFVADEPKQEHVDEYCCTRAVSQ